MFRYVSLSYFALRCVIVLYCIYIVILYYIILWLFRIILYFILLYNFVLQFVVLYCSVLFNKFLVTYFYWRLSTTLSDGSNRLTRVRVWKDVIQSLMENTGLTLSQKKNFASLPPLLLTFRVEVVARSWPWDLFIVLVMTNRYEGSMTSM